MQEVYVELQLMGWGDLVLHHMFMWGKGDDEKASDKGSRKHGWKGVSKRGMKLPLEGHGILAWLV